MLDIRPARQSSLQFPASSFFCGLACVMVMAVFGWPQIAEAGIVRGVQGLLMGVLQIPLQTLAGTFNGPPVIGTALGALNGAMRTVGMVTSGAVELAASGLGIAKSVAPFLLPFLF